MRNYALFQMWAPFRQSLIERHLFYVEQARKRLLSQFDDIKKEADRAEDEWLEQHKKSFDPERHDPADFYEMANDAAIEFYQLLTEMRDRTRLSVVAGMFHEWDKQFRKWLVDEIRHWHSGDKVKKVVWSANFSDIADLLEQLGWMIRSKDYFKTLDICRLVVNVYKHGYGNSLSELRLHYPEYFDNPLSNLGEQFSDLDSIDYTHLAVSDAQFQGFSDAIVKFWQDVPDYIYDREDVSVPNWFDKAMLSDQKASNRGG